VEEGAFGLSNLIQFSPDMYFVFETARLFPLLNRFSGFFAFGYKNMETSCEARVIMERMVALTRCSTRAFVRMICDMLMSCFSVLYHSRLDQYHHV